MKVNMARKVLGQKRLTVRGRGVFRTPWAETTVIRAWMATRVKNMVNVHKDESKERSFVILHVFTPHSGHLCYQHGRRSMLSHPEVDARVLCTYGGHSFLHQRQVCIHLFSLGRLLHSSNIHPPFYDLYLRLRSLSRCVHEDSGVGRFPSSQGSVFRT